MISYCIYTRRNNGKSFRHWTIPANSLKRSSRHSRKKHFDHRKSIEDEEGEDGGKWLKFGVMATFHKDCLGSIGKNNSILRKNVKRCRPTTKHRLNARVRVVPFVTVSFLMCPKKEEKRVKSVVFWTKTSHKRAKRTRFSVLTLKLATIEEITRCRASMIA